MDSYHLPRGNQRWTASLGSALAIPMEHTPSTGSLTSQGQEAEGIGQLRPDTSASNGTVNPPTPSAYQQNVDSSPFPDTSYSTFPSEPYHQLPERQDDKIKLLPDQIRSPRKSFFYLHSRAVSPSPSRFSPPTGPPPLNRRLVPPWRWRWKVSWNMYLFLLFGVACAVGHHIFYTSINGKLATDQVRMLRYGTLLAVAAKAGLSAAVIVAFRQILWTTVRSRLMSIAALDSLFAATDDLAALANWELIKDAKVAVLLAGFVWLSSLVIILTSNTLLVEPRMMRARTNCPGVRTLNFTFEETADWRNPKRIGQLFAIPASLWNTTKPKNESPEGWFDYYTAPSPSFQRTATIGAYLEQAVTRKHAHIETCGSGWNCSFIINFTAPAYKCTELASGVGSNPTNLTQESGTIAPPFSLDILLPTGNYTYYAFATGGEYSSTQMKDAGIGGIPKSKPPYPKTMGAFRTEPIVWIGYSKIADPSKPVPIKPSDPSWNTAFIPTLFACENYEASYTVNFTYTSAMQSTHITSLEYLRPIINTTYLPAIDSNDGTADNVTATPKSNYICPQDTPLYRLTAAYHSLGYMLRFFINGTIAMEDKTLVNPVANTNAIQTKLIDAQNNYFPHPNLPELIQSFYQDIILSMLGTPEFANVVWAADPSIQSGSSTLLPPDDDTSFNPDKATQEEREKYWLYPCTKFRMANVYYYSVRDLWIVYSIACLLAVFGVIVGAVAIHGENEGAVRDTRFSSIVAATRGAALERVRWDHNSSSSFGGGRTRSGLSVSNFFGGGSGGRDDDGESIMRVSEDVKKLRVGYGLLRRGREFINGDENDNGNRGHGRGGGLSASDDIGGGYAVMGTGSEVVMGKGYYYGFGLEGDVKQIPRKGRGRSGSV